GDNHGRLCGAVGNRIPARLHPSPARPRETRIGARRGKSGGWVALDLPLGLVQRGPKGANGLHALVLFVVLYEGANLAYHPRGVSDQLREAALRGDAATCLASSRA